MIEQQSDLFQRDDTILSAWNSQVADAARTPLLSWLFAQRRDELFLRFAKSYVQLRALPRHTRRALQRRLARSRELTHIARERMHRPDGRALQHKLAWSLAGAALLLALGQGVQAATITVNTTNADINIGDGKCSLSEAIINANDTITGQPIADCGVGNPAGADTIQLSAGTHTISTPYSNAALPPITSQITIEGNNAKIARKRTAPPATVIVTTSSGVYSSKTSLSPGRIIWRLVVYSMRARLPWTIVRSRATKLSSAAVSSTLAHLRLRTTARSRRIPLSITAEA